VGSERWIKDGQQQKPPSLIGTMQTSTRVSRQMIFNVFLAFSVKDGYYPLGIDIRKPNT